MRSAARGDTTGSELTPIVTREGPLWAHGQAGGVRAAHDRRAGHPVRPAVVHRRARHPQVGGDRARRARGRLRRGDRLRRVGDRGLRPRLRVGHARQARPGDLLDAARGAARARASPGCSATSSCRTARRRTPIRATSSSARSPRRPTSASPSTRTPRSSSTCSRTRPAPGTRPGARRQLRLLRQHPARRRARLPPQRHHACSSRWASPSSSATTRAGPASRRSTCATPTR